MQISDIIPVALNQKKSSLILNNVQIFNVFTGEIEKNNIAIYENNIAGIGQYSNAEEYLDCQNYIALPGFIDAHLHIESSMLTPEQFGNAVLTQGTTTVIADPHEIANVMGIKGIDYMINATQNIPLSVYFSIPSAVPATCLETSGAELNSYDILNICNKYEDRIISLGEVMNFPAVLNCDKELCTKIEILSKKHKKIDGHAPGLSTYALNAYICASITSDHECTSIAECLEKVKRGMQVFIREGSAAKNLHSLIGAVNENNHHLFSFCTDDRDPLEILQEGHIDYLLKTAISLGINPLFAIRMATINTAKHFNLHNLGAIAPNYKADIVLVDNLRDMNIKMVIKNGKLVVKDKKMLNNEIISNRFIPKNLFNPYKILLHNLIIKAESQCINVIKLNKSSLYTNKIKVNAKIENNNIVADEANDIAKIIVIDRHKASGYSLGFVQGLGIKKGAVVTSVGHDAHNLCIAGMNDNDMFLAFNHITQLGGGMAVVLNNRVLADLSLPIAGLMSDQNLDIVVEKLKNIKKALQILGTENEVFMGLSFIQLSVIPEIKITDKGLVDVLKQEYITCLDVNMLNSTNEIT